MVSEPFSGSSNAPPPQLRETSRISHKFVFADVLEREYLFEMAFRFHCRNIALVTALLFSLSVAGHGFMMTEMSVKLAAATAATDMPADEMCAGCKDDGVGMVIACFAACTSTVAILSDPAPLPIVAAKRETLSAALRLLPGRNGPPDPYPPKPFALS